VFIFFQGLCKIESKVFVYSIFDRRLWQSVVDSTWISATLRRRVTYQSSTILFPLSL